MSRPGWYYCYDDDMCTWYTFTGITMFMVFTNNVGDIAIVDDYRKLIHCSMDDSNTMCYYYLNTYISISKVNEV